MLIQVIILTVIIKLPYTYAHESYNPKNVSTSKVMLMLLTDFESLHIQLLLHSFFHSYVDFVKPPQFNNLYF